MITVYMFRHGQAGDRGRYDTLSELGREQARLLGRYLGHRRMGFDAVFCGTLDRQQLTYRLAAEESAAAQSPLPPASLDERWNEFDITRVFEEMAPKLAASDAGFRRRFEDLQRRIAEPESHVHHQWTPVDNMTVNAWIEESYPYTGESWRQFYQRVMACRSAVASVGEDARVAVFTSATPIAIWMAESHHLPPQRVLELAGSQVNASFSSYLLHEGAVHLLSFNEKPHLEEDRLLTFR